MLDDGTVNKKILFREAFHIVCVELIPTSYTGTKDYLLLKWPRHLMKIFKDHNII